MIQHKEEHNIDELSASGTQETYTSTQISKSVTATNIRPLQNSITSYVQKPIAISN